ncbi:MULTISPECIES: GNAT family N-acetyltransferase [Streptomyces]|uniref:GNAT family N-acetyltransferase n=1 Tax=Streptomyces TaxID=1883 RepID=UPI000A5D661E|nr:MULTISPECIES: GNAT family N-acetyltransferase [Streptomyces]
MPYSVREAESPSAPPRPDGLAPAALDEFELQRRPLTRAEAAAIMRAIRDSPDITGYSAAEWTGRRDTFVLYNPRSGELAGALLVHHLVGRWSEIAVVFLFEEYRGRGLGRRLLQGTLRTLKSADRELLLFFCSPGMGRLSAESGFDVLADEAEFTRGSLRRRIFLSVLYKAQWLASSYRLREIRRKRREFACSFTFKVAVMTRQGAR